MASSDDEGETVPHTVSNYDFVDVKDEPVAFSELPVQLNEREELDGKKKQIFLHGMADNGLQKIYKQVTAWKFDLSDMEPEISVLSKENNWIKLQKPRKSFEDTIRTILITVYCLHFLKKNPDILAKPLWDHLSKVFRYYEPRPSINDLIDHTALISEVVKRDETLAKSKFLVKFLEEKPQKQKDLDESIGIPAKTGFIVDDDMIDEIEEEEGSDEEDLFDSVCAICDNGGALLCCEGRCLRSFHAAPEDGSESWCQSLGFTREQVEAIQNQNYFCKNCQYKKHQCFSCGELGSSDKSAGAEVFACFSATCGRFYHPHCAAKLLHRGNATAVEQLQKKIASGESFTCPLHKCIVCDQFENKADHDLQFAICRRCPKSYHRKCLPREIAFEDIEDEDIIQRAWENLIPDHILIYCLEHEIDDELGTPIRNHIKFPDDGQKMRKQVSQQLPGKEKVVQKDKMAASEDAPEKRTLVKVKKEGRSSSQVVSAKRIVRSTGLEYSKKQKLEGAAKKPTNKTAPTKVGKSTSNGDKPSLGEQLYALISKGAESDHARNKDIPDSDHKKTLTTNPVVKEISSPVQLDENSKRRILALMKDATSSITLEQIIENQKVPTTHAYSSRNMVDKTITLGKIEGSVEALRAALQKLDIGCSIDDAQALCEPRLLHQIFRWKSKLKVYLAPFLYGMRYTSFGRHFTKVEKLKEIVDVLHYYVQDGDTIVDFCCGANDFSWLMNEKLDKTGKKCFFKNYDIIQAKIDFFFEKKDWMQVKRKDLPNGSQLIMGLNPPFGVNAALANKFIDKALEFKPKLLILIVPRETERLDKKKTPYDLVWEDDELLAGKSFYLPGSVDVNDNQMEDWNVNPPPLYLWSRRDWTQKHKEIAKQLGHLSRIRNMSYLEGHEEQVVSDYPTKVLDFNGQNSMPVDDFPVKMEVHEPLQERGASVSDRHKQSLPSDNGGREVQENQSHGKDKSNEDSRKRKHGQGNHRRGLGETSQERKDTRRHSPVREMNDRGPRHSQPSATVGMSLDVHSSRPVEATSQERKDAQRQSPVREMNGRRPRHSQPSAADDMSLDVHSARTVEASSYMEVSEERDQHVDQNVAHSRYQTELGGSHADYGTRGYMLGNEEPYSSVNRTWSRVINTGPNYGFSNSGEQFVGYQRDTASHGYRSYINELGDQYARDSVIRSQVSLYGQQGPDAPNQRSNYLAGQDPRFSSYSHLGSGPNSQYGMMNNTSTLQRYAPRLDELNHVAMNPAASRSGIPDPLVPRPGYRMDSLGFAAGPYHPYSRQNTSGGWLNE